MRMLILILLSLTCTACRSQPPELSLVQGAVSVRLIEPDDDYDFSSCSLARRVVARDGTQSEPNPFHGTVDRAKILLRNMAVETGANVVEILEYLESVHADDAEGSRISISANAYICDEAD